jgi:arylsulfatase A-like enzyme
MLKDKGVADNTLLWYTADNGPHSQDRDKGNKYSALPSTNGLRQCKASLYEGGIREPGILEWPAKIKKNAQTWHPAYVSDYLPTLLELLGLTHPNPDW